MMREALYLKLFRQALRIRLVEEKIIELYPSDKVQSPVHLSIGQEAIAAGVCEHLGSNDWVFINYRGHAFYLAKGGPMPEFFAEIMGKRSGLSKGKGGSMHLASPEDGVMGASAVVASTISHAVGAALGSKIRGEGRVFVANFGDGATEQGVFHESLNFAALHKLPVLFLCEDNELAVHATKPERQAFQLRELVGAYGIEYCFLAEGFDLLKVSDIAENAINKVRRGEGPVFLHIKTARYKEHVGPGDDFYAGYRSEADIVEWQKRDPLCVDQLTKDKFEPELTAEIEVAVQFAEEAPFPNELDLLSDVE
jgi:TPP-dependent pyruvate/acetoin dehydrogenase alpha subunit